MALQRTRRGDFFLNAVECFRAHTGVATTISRAPRWLAESLAATLDNEVLLERARELGERLRSRAASGDTPPFGFDGLDGWND